MTKGDATEGPGGRPATGVAICGGKKHSQRGKPCSTCSECAKLKPWMVFDAERGYVWGPGYEKEQLRGARTWWQSGLVHLPSHPVQS